MLRRLTLLLLTACQGAAGPETVVARARALAAAAPEVHARVAAARPLDGLESHGAALLKAAPHRVLVARLPEHAAAPLAASDSGAARRALSLTLRDAAAVKAQPSGDWLVYANALTDTDLAMFAGDTLVEALFVMRSPAAPRQVDYRLEVAAGLQSRTSALGIELVDASGDVALRIPPSRAFDAHGTELPVRQWLEGDALHLALQREPTAWPVLLDPVVEVAVWQQLKGGDPLPAAGAVATYDSARDRVVLFGGTNAISPPSGDTWEWDGAEWHLMAFTGANAVRSGAAAYDPNRRVTVLYGGVPTAGAQNETWEWDGSSWSRKSANPPPGGATYLAAMVWEAARQRLVMFGGTAVSSGLDSNATVTWDGTSWSIVTTFGPDPRHGAALAEDPGRGVVVLFGGANGGTLFGDTWELSGSTWTQRSPSPPLPSARLAHAMSYSPERGTVVMSGGITDGGVVDELWEWNGTSWAQLPDPPCGPRQQHNFVYDSKRHRHLLLMGFDSTQGPSSFGDVWQWDGGAWQDVTPLANPSRRNAAAMAYDAKRGVTTLFGGSAGTLAMPTLFQDTFEWDGTSWAPRPGPQPAATVFPAMAFDANRGVQVLSTGAGETWEWDGGTWQQRPAALPAAATALAYDGVRGLTVAVVDGGVFEYAGSTWSARAFAGAAPVNTTQFRLTADGHGNTWLFGGTLGGMTPSGQIWAWDGGAWAPFYSPTYLQRERASWLWDVGHDVGVLFGGATSVHMSPDDDTELFSTVDGGTWTALSGMHPPGRVGGAFAYDSRRGRALLFGGSDNYFFITYFNDTWELSWLRANGSDCSDAGQCVSGFCTDGVCCSTATCARCGACNLDGLGTCSAVAAGSPGTPACAPYLCDGLAMSCPMSCSSDAGCATGSACAAGMCSASLPMGAECINDAQCLSGHCVGSICCTAACDGGCQTCRQSEGASQDGVCGARPASHTCRGAADQCDVAETCDGASPDCPSDKFLGPDVMCRGAADTCDLPEFCTGSSAQCPQNQLKPMGATCTSSLQTCAAAAQCDGVSPLCPASAPADAQTPCRSMAGPCDRPELCDGVHVDCPADELLPAGTSCGDEQQCVAECNGTSVECSPCAPVSRFAFGCAAAPGPALGLLLVVLRRRPRRSSGLASRRA